MKPKDYEPSGEIEAENEYAAWALLRNSEAPLVVGDLLELASGDLRICKYVGFDEARWVMPEPPREATSHSPAPDSEFAQA